MTHSLSISTKTTNSCLTLNDWQHQQHYLQNQQLTIYINKKIRASTSSTLTITFGSVEHGGGERALLTLDVSECVPARDSAHHKTGKIQFIF